VEEMREKEGWKEKRNKESREKEKGKKEARMLLI